MTRTVERWAGREPTQRSLAPWLAAPAALVLVVYFVIPLVVFTCFSFLTAGFFSVSGPLTMENYLDAVDSSPRIVQNTVIVAMLVSSITVAVGFPVAFWIRYSVGRWANLVLLIVISCMVASYLVRIYSWRTILQDSGVMNQVLRSLGLIDEPLGIGFGRLAIVLALVHIFLPYVVLVLYAGFRPLTVAHLEAAEDLGANAATRWLRVVLPLMAAPAVTAFWFVFVLSASDYVTPQFLGSSRDVMLGVEIQAAFRSGGNWPLGAATALVMLVAFVLAYAVTALLLRLLKFDRIVWS